MKILLKSLLALTLFFVSSSLALAQGDGIVFADENSWEELLNLAKKQDKLIFMDAYTTWCGPCKKMSKEVFIEKSVGDYFNENFINVKMDMEKGEGITLAETYNVQAYPTLLFINGEGELIHRAAGYHNSVEFVKLAEVALDPSKNLSAMKTKFEAGDREPEFLKRYAKMLYDTAEGNHGEVAEAYISMQKDLSTPDNMEFIFFMIDDAESRGFKYMKDNLDDFKEMFGEGMVMRKIQNMIYAKIYQAETTANALEEVEDLFKEYFPENAGLLYATFKMNYYRQQGDRTGYANAAVERFKNFPSDDPGELNEAGWTFYRVIEDKALLKEAIKWTKKSIKLEESSYNLDTLAHLYYKTGKTRCAKKYAKKAINLAKKEGEDYSTTQELLDTINAGK